MKAEELKKEIEGKASEFLICFGVPEDWVEAVIKEGQLAEREDELKWLRETFKELREVRTQVAGLSALQWRINDRIKLLEMKR